MKEKQFSDENGHSWEIIHPCRVKSNRGALDNDKIYFKTGVGGYYNKKYRNKNSHVIYIGKKIADLMKWDGGDRIDLSIDRTSNSFIKLHKSSINTGYTLTKAKTTTTFRIQIIRDNKDFPICSPVTTAVPFDIFKDKSIVLNLEEFKVSS